jgi:hypothetical protein
MIKNKQEVSILVNGNNVKEYVQNGHTYIEAKSGSTFSIRLKNNEGSRVMAIISVDGIDVITGDKASDTKTGYVLAPYSSVEIKGYRVDSESEATFKFTKVGRGKGYAEIKGDSSNVGSIGVKFISEKQHRNLLTELNELEENFPINPFKPKGNMWPNLPHDKYPSIPKPYYEQPIWCSTDVNKPDLNLFRTAMEGEKSVCMNNSTSNDCNNSSDTNKNKGFDLTTEWGSKIESKITTTKFKIGNVLSTFVFLYASKESL